MPNFAVSDQSFLLAFALSAVCAATAAQLWRIIALNHSDLDPTRSRASTPPLLDPIEAAYVAGGQRLAFTVSKAGLASVGLLDRHERAARGPSDSDALGPVSRAILSVSTTSTSLNWPRCCDDPALQEALAGLGADLQARGVLLADDRRRLLALACAPLAFIDVLGLCRLASTFAAGRPDPTLVVAVGFVALICAGVLATVPRGTRLGLDLTRAAELPGGDRALASLANSRRGCDGGQPVPQ